VKCSRDEVFVFSQNMRTGKPFDVAVLDPRGRQVWSGQVELNTFGSFHCHFLIPRTGPQDKYRIDVRKKEGESGNPMTVMCLPGPP
jgi:uncharacterized protein YfaS (alpha-2-macroglobulin family)